MIKLLALSLLILSVSSCTKEVYVDIPGYQEQLVIDGFIETGSVPLVLLSKTSDIYAATDLQAYLDGFVSGAIVTISDGTTTVHLDEICTDNLPPGTESYAAELFGLPVSELSNYKLCVYTTFSSPMIGEVGKSYTLTVSYEGKTYTSTTTILPPTPLADTYWKEETGHPGRGYSWGRLADPTDPSDSYMWEVKYLGDNSFTKTYNPAFDDQFFNGLTFDFPYENPMTWNDKNVPQDDRGFFLLNDTIVIKLSKMDESVFQFYKKKYAQLSSAGNPFATPTNIPSNIKGGALGVWAGFSPFYDTLICVP